MKTILTPEELVELIPSRSSVLTKVPPETRREVNRAIIERNPMTYEAVYYKFELDKLGVSYTSFYYYARRIRTAASVNELSKLTGDAHELVPEAIAQSVLEIALDHALAPKHLHHAARAYKDVEQARAARKRIDLAEKAAEETQKNWLAREAVRQENRLALADIRHNHKLELAHLKIEAAKEARVSKPAASSPQSADSSEPYPPGARYGRDPATGRPYTRKEFMKHLREACYDIYGLNLPGEGDPKHRPLHPDKYEHLIDENGDLTKKPYHDYVKFDPNGPTDDYDLDIPPLEPRTPSEPRGASPRTDSDTHTDPQSSTAVSSSRDSRPPPAGSDLGSV